MRSTIVSRIVWTLGVLWVWGMILSYLEHRRAKREAQLWAVAFTKRD